MAANQKGIQRLTRLQEFRQSHWLRAGLERLNWHIHNSDFDWDHQRGGKLPRNHMWRPFRFCVQDVVLGLTVLRHNRSFNCLEVDVFLTTSIPEYQPDSGAKALALLLLSEAYRCGGTMEVRFTPAVEDGCIPVDLLRLGTSYGMVFRGADHGIIHPDEAKRLYVAITEFAPDIERRINELESAGRISSSAICYAVHHGLWDRREIETILLTCPRPESLLTGESRPEQRHLYLEDVGYGRGALLFGCLERHLRYRAHSTAEGTVLLEDDELAVQFSISGPDFVVGIRCDEDALQVPWLSLPTSGQSVVPAGEPWTVLVRARTASEMEKHLKGDFEYAAELQSRGHVGPTYILIPRDYEKISDSVKQQLTAQASVHVGLMVYPGYSRSFDVLVDRKIKTSGVMRS